MRIIDVCKLKKSLGKSVPTISFDFNDPKTWVNTGNYTLNYLISGDFFKGIPLGKVSMFAGESGAGKSYIVSGNLVKHAQNQGIFVVLIDSENALDESWLKNLGVDTGEDKLMRIQAAMIDDVAKIISEFMDMYKSDYGDLDKDERPKVLFVIDSLGMLLTPTDSAQFEKGEMKGDMGRTAKSLKALVKNCINMFACYEIGMVVTNHTYASQDMFDPDDKISGGSGFAYASSIVVAMKKAKLKEESGDVKKPSDGKKVAKEVTGIKALAKVTKTRYNKPFESVEIKIPWDTGMNPYSGLMELFEKKGFLTKIGNMLGYTNPEGKLIKHFSKDWTYAEMDVMMNEFMEKEYKDLIEFKNSIPPENIVDITETDDEM